MMIAISRLYLPFIVVASYANKIGTIVIFFLVATMNYDVVARGFFHAPLNGVVEVVIFSLILIAIILVFKYFIADESVIAKIFTFANYTYGPLLGLYAFGLFTKLKVMDKAVPLICILAPLATYAINTATLASAGFDFGFSLLILNGLITFIGLYLFQRK